MRRMFFWGASVVSVRDPLPRVSLFRTQLPHFPQTCSPCAALNSIGLVNVTFPIIPTGFAISIKHAIIFLGPSSHVSTPSVGFFTILQNSPSTSSSSVACSISPRYVPLLHRP